jgi:hypothetical protein
MSAAWLRSISYIIQGRSNYRMWTIEWSFQCFKKNRNLHFISSPQENIKIWCARYCNCWKVGSCRRARTVLGSKRLWESRSQNSSGETADAPWQGFTINPNEIERPLRQNERSRQFSRGLHWWDVLRCRTKSENENINLAPETSKCSRFNFDIFAFEDPGNFCSAVRFIEYYRSPIVCSFSGDLIIFALFYYFSFCCKNSQRVMQLWNAKICQVKVLSYRKVILSTSLLRLGSGLSAPFVPIRSQHPPRHGTIPRWNSYGESKPSPDPPIIACEFSNATCDNSSIS